MATLQSPSTPANIAEVDAYLKALRVAVVPRGRSYSVSSVTGTIAAALAAGSTVFAARLDPAAGLAAYLTKIRLRFTTIAAFTVPVTAGRRLALYRGTGAATTGGTALAAAAKKDTNDVASKFNAAGGDMRVATTAALGVAGITFETQEFRTMALTAVGAAGATLEEIYEFDAQGGSPIVFRPGELLAVRNPAAMDAGGTWQLDVDVDWYEV